MKQVLVAMETTTAPPVTSTEAAASSVTTANKTHDEFKRKGETVMKASLYALGILVLVSCVIGVITSVAKHPSSQAVVESPAASDVANPSTDGYVSVRPAGGRRQALPIQPASGTGVFINDRELTQRQVYEFAVTYHTPPVRGRYWYDSRSGAWGYEGRETGGFLQPGHNYGPLAANASNGNTGVFINGREITDIEVMRLQQIFGVVYRGHFWLDGRTGYVGVEGNPTPIANIASAIQRNQQGASFGCGVTACASFNSDGEGYVNVGGGTIVSIGH